MLGLSLIPEARPHKIAAVFEQHNAAKAAHHTLIDYGHFDKKDVDIIAPGDNEARDKIEPETQAIGQTLFVSHLLLGGIGAAVGIAVALSHQHRPAIRPIESHPHATHFEFNGLVFRLICRRAGHPKARS
jgi:hypothetical protein